MESSNRVLEPAPFKVGDRVFRDACDTRGRLGRTGTITRISFEGDDGLDFLFEDDDGIRAWCSAVEIICCSDLSESEE